MVRPMKIGTLFSGIGSPEQGALRVYDDLEMVFACEWDKYARESFNANYEIDEKHFYKDIADMDGKQYKDKIDILIGGSPCQDFSLAGLRKGIDGNKGILIYEYIRIIEEVQPPIFIYENVKGMLSDKGGRTIKDFVAAFREMGYNCHYEVINTKDYGVPQNRERVFIVGFKDMDHYYNFSFAPKVKLVKKLKDILESEVDEKYYLEDRSFELTRKETGVVTKLTDTKFESAQRISGIEGVSPTLITQQGGDQEPKILIKKIGYINQDTQGSAVYSEIGLCPTLCSGTHGYAQGYIEVKQGTKKGFDIALPGDSINMSFPSSLTRRGRVGKQVSQTLDCACSITAVEEDFRIRKLTPRECFRLQDFPDTFKQVVSNSQLYKQAGNSISVNVMEMIFNQIELSRDGNTNQGSLF